MDVPNSLQQFAKHSQVQSRHAQPIYPGMKGSKSNMGQPPIHCNEQCNLRGIGSMAFGMAHPGHDHITKDGSTIAKEGNLTKPH